MSTDDRPVRVLHVDDEPLSRELVAERLEDADDRLAVTGVGDAASGLERLAANPGFDCVLSDHRIPGEDGLAFLERVREQYPRTPFLLYTVVEDGSVLEAAMAAGATDCVRKSFGRGHYRVLARRVVGAVERRRAERDRRRQRAALEATREGVCLLDGDRRIETVDATFRERYGYGPGELVGESWKLLHPEREVRYLSEEVFPAVQSTGEWTGRTVGLRTDGMEIPEWRTVATLPGGGLAFLVADGPLAGHAGGTAEEDLDGERPAGTGRPPSVPREPSGE